MKNRYGINVRTFAIFITLLFFAFAWTSCSGETGETISAASPGPTPQSTLPQSTVVVNDVNIKAEFAVTDSQKSTGLSWRESMGESEGMIFVYTTPERPTFWMHGMQFPLDFIWISEGKVVDLHENVPAPVNSAVEPERVSPSQKIDHVLEVNAGFIKKHNIEKGNAVKITYPADSQR